MIENYVKNDKETMQVIIVLEQIVVHAHVCFK